MSIQDEIKQNKQSSTETIDKNYSHPPTKLTKLLCRACTMDYVENDNIYCSTCLDIMKPSRHKRRYTRPTVHTKVKPITPAPSKPLPVYTPPTIPDNPSNTPPLIRKRHLRKDGLKQSTRRKKRLLENGGSHTQEAWIKLQESFNFCCVSCGIAAKDTPQKYLTKDHIIPISKGGSDDISNIQPMCLKCNFRKNTKLI